MGKFIVAVVHPSDADRLNAALGEAGYRATRVPTTGGFLGDPSSTFFLALGDDDVAAVLAIFERTCSPHEVELPLVLHERLRDLPARVPHAGANVFILDLAGHLRY